jgi:hypothetical protein
MARKSNAQIEAEALERVEEINREAEKRMQAMLPGLMAGFLAELTKHRADLGGGAAPVSAGGDKALLEGLAHAMAKASDPGNRRRIVAPEIMQERAAARQAMKDAILRLHAAGDVPVYTVVRVTFLNETLIHPQFFDLKSKAMKDQEINWPGVPNQSMVPANTAASEIHGHYLRSIGARAGHYLMGFKKVGGEIEQNEVPLHDLDAPVVLTGKEIRRGHPGAPVGMEMSISDALSPDPRRGNPASKPRTQAVLGTTAQPAVVS